MGIPNLQHLQHDPVELERCQKNPAYFYNKYVRKEGQPVLTEGEYEELVKKETLRRNTITTSLVDDVNQHSISYNEAIKQITKIKDEDSNP